MNGVLVCQESYACGGSDEAAYECDECGSLQCTRCELELHRQERMRNHDRVRIAPGHVPFCDQCKGHAGSPTNGSRHRAVVRCQGCKINLCLDCQKRTHSGVSKRKHPLFAYPPCKAPEKIPNAGDGELDDWKAQLEKVHSFLLVDEKEEMQVRDWKRFIHFKVKSLPWVLRRSILEVEEKVTKRLVLVFFPPLWLLTGEGRRRVRQQAGLRPGRAPEGGVHLREHGRRQISHPQPHVLQRPGGVQDVSHAGLLHGGRVGSDGPAP